MKKLMYGLFLMYFMWTPLFAQHIYCANANNTDLFDVTFPTAQHISESSIDFENDYTTFFEREHDQLKLICYNFLQTSAGDLLVFDEAISFEDTPEFEQSIKDGAKPCIYEVFRKESTHAQLPKHLKEVIPKISTLAACIPKVLKGTDKNITLKP